MSLPTVRDIMMEDVVSVTPETSVLEAHAIIAEHNFDGVPVLDGEGKLVGIITEYDLLTKASALHLPAIGQLLSKLETSAYDAGQIKREIAELKTLAVGDVMNTEPLTLPDDAPFEEVLAAFRDHHRVNPIPVIDQDRRVAGVVSRYDVLKVLSVIQRFSALAGAGAAQLGMPRG